MCAGSQVTSPPAADRYARDEVRCADALAAAGPGAGGDDDESRGDHAPSAHRGVADLEVGCD